jgi:hypothetical protein
MIYNFSVYHGGLNETVVHESTNVGLARAEACKLLSRSTDRLAGNMAPDEQVRVVVSDASGLELFTITYIAKHAQASHT